MEIVVRQISGLGNQLFQYAAGRYYGQRYGCPVRMVIDAPQQAVSHGTFARPFLLSHFNIATPYRVMTFFDKLALVRRGSLTRIAGPVNALRRTQAFFETAAQEHTFLPDLPVAAGTKTLYLMGYWQSWEMVQAVEPELRRELSFKDAATGKNAEILAQIAATENPVSLHIRRGDYTLQAEGNRTLPIAYFERAIQHYRQRLAGPALFVFSDDIAWARENLPPDVPYTFIDHNQDAASFEDLRLMSACHHHIIANSSFSWWGAWLNPRADKTVYAPRYWFLTDDSYYPGMMGPEWTLDGIDPRPGSRQ